MLKFQWQCSPAAPTVIDAIDLLKIFRFAGKIYACGPRKAENGEGIHLPEFCNQPVSAILVVVKLHKTTDAKHIGRTHGIRFPVPCI